MSQKGRFCNVTAERRLRDCTTLSMKHPFKSVMLRTLCREIGIKFYNAAQRRFYLQFVRHFFSTPSLMRREIRSLNSVYNAYYWWRACTPEKMSNEEALRRWAAFHQHFLLSYDFYGAIVFLLFVCFRCGVLFFGVYIQFLNFSQNRRKQLGRRGYKKGMGGSMR